MLFFCSESDDDVAATDELSDASSTLTKTKGSSSSSSTRNGSVNETVTRVSPRTSQASLMVTAVADHSVQDNATDKLLQHANALPQRTSPDDAVSFALKRGFHPTQRTQRNERNERNSRKNASSSQ